MIPNQVRTRWGPHFRGFTTLARACSLRAHRTLPLCRPVTNSSEARVLITIDGSSVSQPRSGAVCMLAKTCFLHTKVDQMFVFRGFFLSFTRSVRYLVPLRLSLCFCSLFGLHLVSFPCNISLLDIETIVCQLWLRCCRASTVV